MKLHDLSLSSSQISLDRRAFNEQGDVVAERFLYSLSRKYDTGSFRKIVVSCMNVDDDVRQDLGAIGVLVLYVAFDFAAYEKLEHTAKQQLLMRLLHTRLVQAAHDYRFEVPPLEAAFVAASAMSDAFVFPTKFRANFAKPYRSAQLVFRCNGIILELYAQIKVSRNSASELRLVTTHDTGPSIVSYLIEGFEWLNEDQLSVRFIRSASTANVVLSIRGG